MSDTVDSLARDVRLYVFGAAAETARVPQAPQIAGALRKPESEIQAALRHLAANRIIILASNDTSIWTAPPFCAVPSGFRVRAHGKSYWAICIWDALGIAAALGADAEVTALCGDCGEGMSLEIRSSQLTRTEGVAHFAVPARRWWDNIGFT